ncbi:unnamed protein product [Sphagnum compactum]
MAPCLCAPTNHAGSFRCRLHRSSEKSWGGRPLASSSSSSAKGPLHSAETSSSKPGENRSGKRIMVPFARSNRVSTSKSSESKFRTELNRTLVAASKKEESVPSVEELRISTSEEVPKKAFKIAAKTTAAPVAGSIALRIVQEDQENAANLTDLTSTKVQKESTLHPHHKAFKKCTSKERRLRAKSGTFLDPKSRWISHFKSHEPTLDMGSSLASMLIKLET